MSVEALRRLGVVALRVVAVMGTIAVIVVLVGLALTLSDSALFRDIDRGVALSSSLADLRLVADDLRVAPTDPTRVRDLRTALAQFEKSAENLRSTNIYDPIWPLAHHVVLLGRHYATARNGVSFRAFRAGVAHLAAVVSTRTRVKLDSAHAQRRRYGVLLGELSLGLMFLCGVLVYLARGPGSTTLAAIEVANEERDERAQALFETFPEGLILFDVDARISEVNDMLVRVLGKRRRDLIEGDVRAVFVADVAAACEARVARALGGESGSFDAVILDAAGDRQDVRVTMLPVHVGENVVGSYAVLRTARELVVIERKVEVSAPQPPEAPAPAPAKVAPVPVKAAPVPIILPVPPPLLVPTVQHPVPPPAEDRFRSLFESNLDGGIAFDSNGDVEFVNDAMLALSGFTREEFQALSFATILGAVRDDDLTRRFGTVLDGIGGEFDARLRRKDGNPHNVRVRALPFGSAPGHRGVAVFAKDVTPDEAQRRRASDQRERLRALSMLAAAHALDVGQQLDRTLEFCLRSLEVNAAVVSSVDVDQGTLEVVRTAGSTFSSGQRFALSQTFSRHVFGRHRMLVIDDTDADQWRNDFARRNEPWRSLIGTTLFVGERTFGTLLFGAESMRESAFDSADIDFVQLVAVLIGSALERAERDRALGKMAVTDPLTGLPNRAYLLEHLPRSVAAAERTGSQLAVLYIDLDGFKPINDRLGHAAGDEVLQRVADRLRQVVRGGDLVARVGGDEFVVVQTSGHGVEDARRLADRIVQALGEAIDVEGSTAFVGASIGVAIFPDDGDETEDLLRSADAKMYRTKRARKRSVG